MPFPSLEPSLKGMSGQRHPHAMSRVLSAHLSSQLCTLPSKPPLVTSERLWGVPHAPRQVCGVSCSPAPQQGSALPQWSRTLSEVQLGWATSPGAQLEPTGGLSVPKLYGDLWEAEERSRVPGAVSPSPRCSIDPVCARGLTKSSGTQLSPLKFRLGREIVSPLFPENSLLMRKFLLPLQPTATPPPRHPHPNDDFCQWTLTSISETPILQPKAGQVKLPLPFTHTLRSRRKPRWGGSGGLLEGFLEKGQLPFLIEVQLIYTGDSDSKESACNARDQVWPLGWEDLEKRKATHFSSPAWRIPWTEKLGKLQSMGS